MRLISALLMTLSVLAVSGQQVIPTPEEMAAETARINDWFDARFEEQLDFSPIRRTFLGDKQDYDKITDFSEAAQDEQLAWHRGTVEALKHHFDRNTGRKDLLRHLDLPILTRCFCQKISPQSICVHPNAGPAGLSRPVPDRLSQGG